jgi:hypothetical protein
MSAQRDVKRVAGTVRGRVARNMPVLWDPLEKLANNQDEILSATRKREIQNILKSYVGFYDAFCELIQNAMDAVDVRQAKDTAKTYQKHIWIEIDLRENSLSVTDNGIGFKEAQFKTFLAPSISYKSGAKSRGKKGVGATYLAYGFNYLQAGTKTPEYTIVTELRGGRDWVDDREGIVTRPHVYDSEATHYAFNVVDMGATFTVKFGASTRPKTLNWISATTAEQWKAVLLLKTPLGHISHVGGDDGHILFDIRVTDEDGRVTELVDQEAVYTYPHTAFTAVVDVKEVLDEQRKRLERNMDPTRLPAKFANLNGVHFTWDTESLKKIIAPWDKPEYANLIQQFSITAYGFFCYTVKIWDHYNDSVLKLRKSLRIMKGGLQLASDKMVQGESLVIPLSQNIGYQNQAHIVVHFAHAEPDLGRKGFQPELRDVAEKISVSIVNFFKGWRSLLKKDTGAAPSIVGATMLAEWLQEQIAHEERSPLTIKNPNFFAPLHEISIASTPRVEQDVIVLFNQLIAGGVVRGIRLLAASQTARYDAVFRYVVRAPAANHVFDRFMNPLGVQELRQEPPFTSNARILEYKFNIDALIQDFETGQKSELDVSLAVAWEIGTDWRKRYAVTSMLDLDAMQSRECHGVTHAFHDQASGDLRFYAIILSELVAYLNDIDGVQAFHKATYGGLV